MAVNRGIAGNTKPMWLAAKRPVLGRGVAKAGIVSGNGRLKGDQNLAQV